MESEVIGMNEERLREIFKNLFEEEELDPEVAERILQRILKIIFGEDSDKKDSIQ